MYYINLANPLNKRISFENQRKAAEEIGLTPEALCRILRGKVGTTKMTAYCITKCYNKNADIKEYFTYEEE